MAGALKMLAFDFGASSGRAILGILDGGKLTLEEIHRFSNDPVELRGSIHWDILRLFHEIRQGLVKCVNRGHRDIASVAVDTWGVDFGLLDRKGNLLCNPYHYRDSNTDGIMDVVFKTVPKEELYEKTGIQHMKFNSVFQLYSMKYRDIPVLKEADALLLIPDLFNYFLTGVKAAECSIASTTGLVDPADGGWSGELIQKLGLPGNILPGIVPTGSIIGKLSRDIAAELGIGEIPVIATASHDTQSAVASIPAGDSAFAYISCGTWSLMGIEVDSPIINEKSSRLSFTNERGVGGKTTFHKNIMGLWLVQECKRQWDHEGENTGFAELEKLALGAERFKTFVDPDNEIFMAPGNMPARVRDFCSRTGQAVPQTKAEIMRCIYQSIALKYRQTVEMLEEITGRQFPVIHMVGGGIKDKTLCRFTAGSTGRKVVAGPVEATSAGNLLIQALALGRIKDLPEIRKVVSTSFPTEVYEPEDNSGWTDAYGRYREIIKTTV